MRLCSLAHRTGKGKNLDIAIIFERRLMHWGRCVTEMHQNKRRWLSHSPGNGPSFAKVALAGGFLYQTAVRHEGCPQ
jgi:hypothetical protein